MEIKPETLETDTIIVKPYKSAIKLNPFRLFEGTFQLSYERAINDKFSIDVAGLGTYVSKSGMGGGYLTKQDLEFYNAETNSYNPYNPEMLTGWGIFIQAKSFLLTKYYSNLKAPIGLYAAPQLMYRDILITGIENVWTDTVYVEKEVKQNLDVLAAGVILGVKFAFLKVLCIDMYVGGVLRLSKYTDEKSCTKYKQWNNIDYSGVLPAAGINIGILKK